jgi:hypothetical protein
MADIDDLVQEFWRSTGDGAVRTSFFPMRRLLEILQKCFNIVCFDNISFFLTAVNLVDKKLQMSTNSLVCYAAQDEIRDKFKMLFDRYRKIFDQSFYESNDLGDILRFLPGVVVQKKPLSVQGMTHLYRIKPDILERLIKSTVMIDSEGAFSSSVSHYILDDYIRDFLLDRDRSQLYYSDLMLQHISICHQNLSSLDGSNAFDLRS